MPRRFRAPRGDPREPRLTEPLPWHLAEPTHARTRDLTRRLAEHIATEWGVDDARQVVEFFGFELVRDELDKLSRLLMAGRIGPTFRNPSGYLYSCLVTAKLAEQRSGGRASRDPIQTNPDPPLKARGNTHDPDTLEAYRRSYGRYASLPDTDERSA